MFIDSVYLVRFLVWGAVILFGWSAVAALLKTDLFAPLLVKWRGMSRFQKGMIVSVLLAVTAWAGDGLGKDRCDQGRADQGVRELQNRLCAPSERRHDLPDSGRSRGETRT